MQLILDTSVIIAFCTESKHPYLFELLIKNQYDLFAPTGVINEIKQKDVTYPELKKLMDKKTIVSLKQLDENEVLSFNNRHPYLNRGEIEVLLHGLTLKRKTIQYYCVIDDKRARKVAHNYGLTLIGSIGLLDILCRTNIISSVERANIIHDLRASGFRIKSP